MNGRVEVKTTLSLSHPDVVTLPPPTPVAGSCEGRRTLPARVALALAKNAGNGDDLGCRCCSAGSELRVLTFTRGRPLESRSRPNPPSFLHSHAWLRGHSKGNSALRESLSRAKLACRIAHCSDPPVPVWPASACVALRCPGEKQFLHEASVLCLGVRRPS